MEGNLFCKWIIIYYCQFWDPKKGIPTHTASRLQRWETIVLNYNYEMEFLPSRKLGHEGSFSRLIPKFSVPLEDAVIAALKSEKEVKDMLCDTVKELPVTLDEIRGKAENDAFIKKMKTQVRLKERNNTKVYQPFQHVTMSYYMLIGY